MEVNLEDLFPRLQTKPYQTTSPVSDKYNCIAWAAGDSHRLWWPDVDMQDYWPEGAPREETLEAFERAFLAVGFISSASTDPEQGYEKIALFTNQQGVPKHAARQLPSGRWTSKLGVLE